MSTCLDFEIISYLLRLLLCTSKHKGSFLACIKTNLTINLTLILDVLRWRKERVTAAVTTINAVQVLLRSADIWVGGKGTPPGEGSRVCFVLIEECFTLKHGARLSAVAAVTPQLLEPNMRSLTGQDCPSKNP